MQTPEMIALSLLREHRIRTRLLGRLGRLAEPCWLILLRVYVDRSSSGPRVTNVLYGLNYGYGTMHRYLARLEKEHFITSHVNRHDKRLRLLKLTPSTRYAMDQLLHKIALEEYQISDSK